MNKYLLILLTIIIIGTLSYFVITSNETLKVQTSTNTPPIKNQILEQND